MEDQQDSFLEVRLTATGAAQLKRLPVTTRWLFIIGMLLNLLLVTNALLRHFLVDPEKLRSNLPLYIEARLFIWYALAYSVLITFQLRYYLRFTREARMGAEKLDTTQFNNAFQLLNKANTVALIHFSLSILIGFLETWVNVTYAKIIMHR